MDERERLQEQNLYEVAKKWLEENGEFKTFPFKQTAMFNATFSNESFTIERTGTDIIRLTIQIYNEVKN